MTALLGTAILMLIPVALGCWHYGWQRGYKVGRRDAESAVDRYIREHRK